MTNPSDVSERPGEPAAEPSGCSVPDMGHVQKVAEQDPGCDRGMKLDVDQLRSQATPQKTCNLDTYFLAEEVKRNNWNVSCMCDVFQKMVLRYSSPFSKPGWTDRRPGNQYREKNQVFIFACRSSIDINTGKDCQSMQAYLWWERVWSYNFFGMWSDIVFLGVFPLKCSVEWYQLASFEVSSCWRWSLKSWNCFCC